MKVNLDGPALPVETCARRLAGLGVATPPDSDGEPGRGRRLSVRPDAGAAGDLDVDISWHGPSALPEPATEATVQAVCGLMQVHGRDAGEPRRLGLEVASVASGVLAAQAVLAALVGAARGRAVRSIGTSVLEAGLVLTSHYVAAATSADPGDWSPPPPGADPGPPFVSADGRRFEIETLDPEAWRAFWSRLGAGGADLGRGWTLFRARYFRGTCTLPEGLHAATARHRLADLAQVAAACLVSLTPVRGYDEVLGEGDLPAAHPRLTPLAGASPGPASRDPAGAPGDDARLPLEGVRVVEATSRMQGPLAGLLLQMLGAHVVRVEPPGGDPIRLVPPYTGDQGYFYACFNRGKEALELDLSSPSDRAVVLDLAAGADVFLQNWRPGRAAEWGLDVDAVAARNPRTVYVHASGWGGDGRNRHLLGTDFLVQAYAGLADALTPEGDPPAPSRALLTDCLGALVTCEGALAGLLARERTGQGRHVDASLLAGGMTLHAHVLDALRAGGEVSRRRGRPLWGPLDRPLETGDGHLVVDVAEADGLGRLREACAAPAGATRDEDGLAVAERLRERPAAEWEKTLGGAGVPAAAVRMDLGALTEDLRLAPLFEPLPGGARAPGSPWRFAP